MPTPAAQFKEQARRLAADLRHRQTIQTAMRKYEVVRDQRKAAFQDWEGARRLAAQTKWHALEHLGEHLERLTRQLEARGARVHWASTGAQAREIILGILRERQARMIVKSKAMTAEEIHLNEALQAAGYEVVESDLGEFIVQLREEPPYHLVFPAMHLTRGEIRDVFLRKLGDAPSDVPEELTMVARRVLRDKYLRADAGITGANFAIAETGMISITENEGNARLTAALPRTMITLVGIEKVLPRLEDLALFLPMLAVMGTGQPITCYNTLYAGPRQPGEPDGPEEYHVVLLDNGRTALLADPEERDALRCIRCGACLNVCPIFRNVGGHTYGTVYGGPIGSVITPNLLGLQPWKHLSYASSLCGACTETCPVQIDLHHHLLRNRRNAAAQKPRWLERLAFRIFACLATRPALWSLTTRLARVGMKLRGRVNGSALDPARAWTATRDLPPVAKQSFREWWRTHNDHQRQEKAT
ncbi:MAG: LutB/LldF family L-lactate oxidation iron-sulfur protein [Verrucomicrobiae bacterium]|nr:LutB/LldF family L-lactate oxidation iron-sulfur protein [Verrucomicrobiae bacterium]MDW8308539.1 LutB/LldF family L-lactate oxidation iron-sulfur protein [Verrucomicrobiales bacterium]